MAEKVSGIGKLLDLAKADARYLAKLEELRRNITVMFTDIHGSTPYFEQYGDAAGLLMVCECNEALGKIAASYDGRVIKTMGDGMMATFESSSRALQAAIDMQRGIAEANLSRPKPDCVGIRIGIHYDTGIVRSDDVFGDVVNVASRVESVALPGQILISEHLYETITDQAFHITKKGRFLLKGKQSEVTLYEVGWDAAVVARVDRGQPPESLPAIESFRIQVLDERGGIRKEYPVKQSATIGRSGADLAFPQDSTMTPVHARVFMDDGQLFVSDLSDGLGRISSGSQALMHCILTTLC